MKDVLKFFLGGIAFIAGIVLGGIALIIICNLILIFAAFKEYM